MRLLALCDNEEEFAVAIQESTIESAKWLARVMLHAMQYGTNMDVEIAAE